MISIGSVLDRKYEVIKVLGQGGMSRVYLCRNNRLGNLWAIKEVKKELQCQMGFLAEPNILKKLNHSGIPRIIDIFYENNNLYIVEDYIEGQTLENLIDKEGSLDDIKACEIALELCEILAYLHSFEPPIIYRDLKPSNVMITPKNEVKLIDFGISRVYKESKSTDTIYMGSKGYAAPEQYGLSQSNIRTDIYGLGTTMYFMLMGNPPDGFTKPLNDNEYADVNNELKKIVMKAMQIEQSNRYADVSAMKSEIIEFLQVCSKTRVLNFEIRHESDITKTLLLSKTRAQGDYKNSDNEDRTEKKEETTFFNGLNNTSDFVKYDNKDEKTKVVNKKIKKGNKKAAVLLIIFIVAAGVLFSLAKLKGNDLKTVKNADTKANVSNNESENKSVQNSDENEKKQEPVIKDSNTQGYINKNAPLVVKDLSSNEQAVKGNGKAKGKKKHNKDYEEVTNAYDIVYELKPPAAETKFNGKFSISFAFIELKEDEIAAYLLVENKTGKDIGIDLESTQLINDSGEYVNANNDGNTISIPSSDNVQKVKVMFDSLNINTNNIFLNTIIDSDGSSYEGGNISLKVGIK